MIQRTLILFLLVAVAGCSGGVRSGQNVPAPADSTARPRAVSTIPGYGEFYRVMRLSATDQISFCFPTSDPRGEASVYAVARDMSGRPTMITRFFFGNPDTRQEWTSMQIEYRWFATTGTMVERRTWHAPGNVPMEVRGAYGVELMYKNRALTMRRLIDKEGRPIGDVRYVIRSFFKEERPGTIIQEWFFGNGKQHYGVGTDDPLHPFGSLPDDAYFRRFWLDGEGRLVREEAWGIGKQPIPYPGGELGRAYEFGDCALPSRVIYLDATGKPATNADGIASVRFAYDDHGRVVEWRASGPDGSPRARSGDGVAAEVYHYRAFDGVLLRTERFDARGELLPEPAPPADGGDAPASTP